METNIKTIQVTPKMARLIEAMTDENRLFEKACICTAMAEAITLCHAKEDYDPLMNMLSVMQAYVDIVEAMADSRLLQSNTGVQQ